MDLTPRTTDPHATRLRDSPVTPSSRKKNACKHTKQARARFLATRESRALTLYKTLNASAFDNKLPHDLRIEWKKTLNTTAGRAILQRRAGLHSAYIELSTKVIDEEERMQNTLAHEMCHVAAWLLKGVCKPPHGPAFKLYAARVMAKHPHLNITTCHSYEIQFKYQYQCTTGWCGHVYGRHSRSIDVRKQRCGRCMGTLTLLPQLKADGTPKKKRQPNKFALFVKVRVGE